MKRLYLIRHAKSSWDDPALADIDRPLNKRGRRDAPFMGERLKRYGVMPDLIYASPAKRARTTARIIAECIGYPGERIEERKDIYTSDMNLLLRLVQGADNGVTSLFMVGHNDVLTDFAEYLTGEVLGNVPTCGIVGMEFRCASWQEVSGGCGEMLFFDYPKKLVGPIEP
jgi:phosphohistidine phosphatase